MDLYLCWNIEAVFQELRRRGKQDILRKTKPDIFTTKNKNWHFHYKKTFTKGNCKGSSSVRRKWSKKQEKNDELNISYVHLQILLVIPLITVILAPVNSMQTLINFTQLHLTTLHISLPALAILAYGQPRTSK